MKLSVICLATCFSLFFPALTFADHYEGELEYVIVTDDHTSQSQWLLLLADGTRVELDGPVQQGWTGKKVRLRGTRNPHSITVHELLEADGSPSLANDLPPPPAPDENIGFLRAAVLFVDFSDKLETTVTVAAVQSAVDTIVEPYYSSVSDVQTSLIADVFGKFTLSINHQCNLSLLIAEAIKAADSTVNFLNYNFVTIVSPTACGYGGIALLGRTNITTADGIIRAGYSNTVTTSGATRMAQIMVHELGNKFRAHHTGFLNCAGVALKPNLGDCTRGEYGNIFSVMGASIIL